MTVWINYDADGAIVAYGKGVTAPSPPAGGKTEFTAASIEEIANAFVVRGPSVVQAAAQQTVTVEILCPSRSGSTVLVQINDSIVEVPISNAKWEQEVIIPAIERVVGWDAQEERPIIKTTPAVTRKVLVSGGMGILKLDISHQTTYVISSGEPAFFPRIGRGTLVLEVVEHGKT